MQSDDGSSWVGAPADRTTGLCNASPVPGADLQACTLPATRHVLCFSRLGSSAGIVSLLTCQRHLPIARAVPHYIGEHTVGPACTDPQRRYELTFVGMLCHAGRSPAW